MMKDEEDYHGSVVGNNNMQSTTRRGASSTVQQQRFMTTRNVSTTISNNNNTTTTTTNTSNTNKRSHLSRRSTTYQEPITEPVHYTSLLCGLIAGIVQAGVFNPYDRALYLSVKDNRPFLHKKNWYKPYTGFYQSITGRALSGGLYFPIEHFFLRYLANYKMHNDFDSIHNFFAGTAAGAFNATILNPISAIKYKTWGHHDTNRGFLTVMSNMIRKAGSIRPLFNGLSPTIARDVTFGGTYTYLRFQIPLWIPSVYNNNFMADYYEQQQIICNFIAAALATIISGPFNYVRNVQFATKSSITADGMYIILHKLIYDITQQHTIIQKLKLIQIKLRIGWGTARVALGMSFAHGIYNWLHEQIQPHQYNNNVSTIGIMK